MNWLLICTNLNTKKYARLNMLISRWINDSLNYHRVLLRYCIDIFVWEKYYLSTQLSIQLILNIISLSFLIKKPLKKQLILNIAHCFHFIDLLYKISISSSPSLLYPSDHPAVSASQCFVQPSSPHFILHPEPLRQIACCWSNQGKVY
jgi:hypothetical protein